jgi:hypothetical protein
LLALTSGCPISPSPHVNLLELLFVAVLFVVGFRRLFRVTSGMNGVRPRHMGMVSRFLVMAGLVVLRCFPMVSSSVGMMLLCLLVAFNSFF